MKLLDKIKNAIFEEDEFEDEVERQEEVKEEKKEKRDNIFTDNIVKKIDIEKTIPKRIEIKEQEEIKQEKTPPKREMRRTPVIFNDEDFGIEEKPKLEKKVEVKKEEVKKPLYGGYKDEKNKAKFKPSPIISPVYGLVGVSPILEKKKEDAIEKHIFVQSKKEEVSLDTVRQKAFQGVQPEEDDDLGLLYDMKKGDEIPAISKITLGDAEEYFEDLGLEYNIDYKDNAKEKEMKKETVKTRTVKNKEISDSIEKDLDSLILDNEFECIYEKKLESTKELEITKEQIKPKTAKEIKKVKKIADVDLGMSDDSEDVIEKNLYDLIDMMYDSK